MNPDLLGDLIDRHAAALELFARQWCDSAEDVVQEAFVKLAGQDPLPDQPVAWLFRSVRNGAVNAGIASRRRKKHETKAAESVPAWFEIESTPEFEPERVQAALESLPIEQREVIVAHIWGGLSFQEIAILVDSSSSTIHRRYQAGLVTLRENLEGSCPRIAIRTDLTKRN